MQLLLAPSSVVGSHGASALLTPAPDLDSFSRLGPPDPRRRCRATRPEASRLRMRSPMAISLPEEQLFGHGRHSQGPPVRELSFEEKQVRVDEAKERIARQTEQRSEKLRKEAHLTHLEHELKFGKLMFAQGSFDSALAHFERVVAASQPDTYFRGEGTLQKAACLERLGGESEAKALYESLVQFRAPYPSIKRRAAQALFGSKKEAGQTTDYDDYMYRMFLSGFGSYMPKEKYVETEEEKIVLRVLPWAMLSMAPLLCLYLLVTR